MRTSGNGPVASDNDLGLSGFEDGAAIEESGFEDGAAIEDSGFDTTLRSVAGIEGPTVACTDGAKPYIENLFQQLLEKNQINALAATLESDDAQKAATLAQFLQDHCDLVTSPLEDADDALAKFKTRYQEYIHSKKLIDRWVDQVTQYEKSTAAPLQGMSIHRIDNGVKLTAEKALTGKQAQHVMKQFLLTRAPGSTQIMAVSITKGSSSDIKRAFGGSSAEHFAREMLRQATGLGIPCTVTINDKAVKVDEGLLGTNKPRTLQMALYVHKVLQEHSAPGTPPTQACFIQTAQELVNKFNSSGEELSKIEEKSQLGVFQWMKHIAQIAPQRMRLATYPLGVLTFERASSLNRQSLVRANREDNCRTALKMLFSSEPPELAAAAFESIKTTPAGLALAQDLTDRFSKKGLGKHLKLETHDDGTVTLTRRTPSDKTEQEGLLNQGADLVKSGGLFFVNKLQQLHSQTTGRLLGGRRSIDPDSYEGKFQAMIINASLQALQAEEGTLGRNDVENHIKIIAGRLDIKTSTFVDENASGTGRDSAQNELAQALKTLAHNALPEGQKEEAANIVNGALKHSATTSTRAEHVMNQAPQRSEEFENPLNSNPDDSNMLSSPS